MLLVCCVLFGGFWGEFDGVVDCCDLWWIGVMYILFWVRGVVIVLKLYESVKEYYIKIIICGVFMI